MMLVVVVFTLFTGLLTSAACDVTSLAGSTVSLDCPSPTVSYSGYFAWRFYSSQQGQVIYSQPPFTLNDDDFPATRYCQVGDFGLEISSVGWPDGGVYACHFLTGQELIKHSVVVVIESPVSQVSRAVVDAGDDVELTCTVEFGSPINTSMWMTRQQFPRLTMAFDNVQLTPDTHEYTAGHPGDTPHTLTTVKRLTADRDDSGKMLSCTVSTEKPAFTVSTDALLHVRAAAYDISITPRRHQYAVNDVITCSAKGFPVPDIHWTMKGDPDDVIVHESNLTVTEEMMGVTNRWTCIAENTLTIDTLSADIEFTVTAENEDDSQESTGLVSKVGLVVIVAAAVVLLIGVIIVVIIIVIIVRRKRRGRDNEGDELVKTNLIYTPTSSSQHPPTAASSSDHPAGSSSLDQCRPVPKPRTASTSSTLDPLDRSMESDAIRPRPRTRGSQESLDKSLDKPEPLRKARMRGSQESLDKSVDKPVAMDRARVNGRGSMESLDDRKKAGRPTPTLRGSRESLDRPTPRARASLDRSLDESELSQKPARPQVPIKASKKPLTSRKDAGLNSDETDV